MTTNTPNLSLVLYDNGADASLTFNAFRTDIAGSAVTSNFYKIDTAVGTNTTNIGTHTSQISSLMNGKTAVLVSAIRSSPGVYAKTGLGEIVSYVTNMSIILKLDITSTGATTLNINSLGAKSVMKVNTAGTHVDITGGELVAGKYYLFIYDGTRFVWVGATVADQLYIAGTSGNVVTVNSDNTLLGTTTQSLLISNTINASTNKATPVDTDRFGFWDSVSSLLKHSTWANIKTTLNTYFNSVYQPIDGWTPNSGTWTYSSIDSPTGIISSNVDMTSIIQKGMRLKYSQDQALTAYFPMDANSTSTVGSFTSTDVATPTYTAGKFSNALTLNGTTQCVQITDTALMKPTGEFTIGMWFKTSNTGATKTLFQSYSDNTNANGIKIEISAANVITVGIGNNSASDSSTFTGTTTVTGGVFIYLVVTFRNNYLQVYVNGVLEICGYCVTPSYAATNYVRIGAGNVTGTNVTFMNGQIDDLYLINGYALDEETIKSKYLLGTAQGTGNITIIKKAIVTDIGVWSGSAQLITLYHGTDFMLVNSTISSPHYSSVKVPFGFNSNPDKWSVIVTDTANRSQSSPTGSPTYYNWFNIVVPIGTWKVGYRIILSANVVSTSVSAYSSLSTTNNTATDSDMTVFIRYTFVTSESHSFDTLVTAEKVYELTSKSTRYMNIASNFTGSGGISIRGDLMTSVVKAVCVYV